MGWLRGKDGAPQGWVKAPPDVELEIRGVWQEDAMPAELKDDPGYVPFMLSGEAQDWVDSMEDGQIMDGGTAVYGHPKPAVTRHRSLATPSAASLAPASVPVPVRAAQLPQSPPTPSAPRILMPDIDGTAGSGPVPAPAPPRRYSEMPDIGDSPPKPAKTSPAPMPDVGESKPTRLRTLPQRVLMPDIDEEPTVTAQPHHQTMPDVGQPAPRTQPPRPSPMPDIADDEPQRPAGPIMPDIG
jgi:hypothetical protein